MERESTAATGSTGEVEPLWDVVEEHLNEAEFCQVEFERTLDHPLLTLDQLAGGVQARLIAHLDGLVIGGATVAERLLLPQIEEAVEQDSARVAAAMVALLHGPRSRSAGVGLFHDKVFVRTASVRGCSLAPSARLEAWAVDRFRETKEPSHRAALMPIAGGLLEAAVLLECLQSEDDALCAATARMVARGERRAFGNVMEHLLEHREPSVRESALVGSLAWGLPAAWAVCERLALDRENDAPLITRLYGALGGRIAHARLSKLLENPKRRTSAISALGYAMNSHHVPELIEITGGADRREAKLAAQAIALITGLDLNDEAYAVPAAEGGQAPRGGTEDEPASPPPDVTEAEALPPLEEDDLASNLVPPPEDALPSPERAAIAKFWQRAGPSFQAHQRYLAGKPANTPDDVLDFLGSGALGARHVIALAFGIRTGGQAWPDTRQFTSRQRLRLAALRALDLRSFSRFFDR